MTQEGQPISLRKRFLRPRTFIALALAAAFLMFIFTRLNVDLAATWQQIKSSNPGYYLAALVVYYASFPLRGLRWKLLLKNAGVAEDGGKGLPPTSALTQMVLLNWFANVILPARVGDIYRPYLLREESGISYSKSLGTVLAERIMDILVVVVMLALAALALVGGLGQGVIGWYLAAGAAVVVVLMVGLWLLWALKDRLKSWMPAKFRPAWISFSECTLRSFRQVPVPAGLSVVIWLTEVMRLYLVANALNVNIPISFVFFVALGYALVVALPTTPGGLGLVEGGMIGLLGLTMSYTSAASVTILDRSVSFLSLIVAGLLLFGWREVRGLFAGRRLTASPHNPSDKK